MKEEVKGEEKNIYSLSCFIEISESDMSSISFGNLCGSEKSRLFLFGPSSSSTMANVQICEEDGHVFLSLPHSETLSCNPWYINDLLPLMC